MALYATAESIRALVGSYESQTRYIYALCCPRTMQVRYVGCTINPQDRKRVHTHSKPTADTPLAVWLRRLHERAQRPFFVVVDRTTTERGGRELERQWIAHYARKNGPLLLNRAENPLFPIGEGRVRRFVAS